MGTVLWWAGNAIVAVVVLPVVAFLAVRIVKALNVVHAAAVDIRSSLQAVAGGIPPAVTALSAVAAACERASERASEPVPA